jgi:predicted GH43/DUF377 family glycosyl hydrolase
MYNYNPAVVPGTENGDYGLLVRCQNITNSSDPYSVGPSVLAYVDAWDFFNGIFLPLSDSNIVLRPSSINDSYGCEDPRVVYNRWTMIYYLFYSAVENNNGVPISRLALATMYEPWNPLSYTLHGPVFPQLKWSKSGALLIQQSGPSYLIFGDSTLEPGLQIAYTNDLLHYHLMDGIFLPVRTDSFDSFLVEGMELEYEPMNGIETNQHKHTFYFFCFSNQQLDRCLFHSPMEIICFCTIQHKNRIQLQNQIGIFSIMLDGQY